MRKLLVFLALSVACYGQTAHTTVSVEGNQTITGNKTFTGTTTTGALSAGATTVTSLNKVYKADQCAGSDASAKINACIALAIADGGGTVDARGLIGAQTISQEIDVGNSSKVPVELLLPHYGIWNVTITNGTSCGIKVFSASSVIGSQTGADPAFRLQSASSLTSVDSLLCTDPSPSSGGSYVRVEGLGIYNAAQATFSTGAVNWQKTFDNSVLRDVAINDYQNDGLVIYGACCSTSFVNVTSNANSLGKRPVFIKADSITRNMEISFYGLSATHPGSGFGAVEISGGGSVTPDNANRGIHFYGLYTEEQQSTNPTTMLKISDAREVSVNGWTVVVIGTPNAGFVGLDISQTASNQVRNINIYDYRYQSTAGGVAISNHITGQTYGTSTAYIRQYSYGGSSGSQPTIATRIVDNETDWLDASGNTLYSTPLTGIFSASSGYRINGNSAASGAILHGDGTKFVSSFALPSLGSVNLTGQTADITATTLCTPPASGRFRISGYGTVTTTAGTSSTFPNLVIRWTDPDNNTAQASTLYASDSGNTLNVLHLSQIFVSAKSGVAITYATSGYASNPATTMQYALHLQCEAF